MTRIISHVYHSDEIFCWYKAVTLTADSPDLSDSVTELVYSMVKSFTPKMCVYFHWRGEYYYISVDIFVAKCRYLYVMNVKSFWWQ